MHGYLTIDQTTEMEFDVHSRNGMTRRQMVNLNKEMNHDVVLRYIKNQGGCERWLFKDLQAPAAFEA